MPLIWGFCNVLTVLGGKNIHPMEVLDRMYSLTVIKEGEKLPEGLPQQTRLPAKSKQQPISEEDADLKKLKSLKGYLAHWQNKGIERPKIRDLEGKETDIIAEIAKLEAKGITCRDPMIWGG